MGADSNVGAHFVLSATAIPSLRRPSGTRIAKLGDTGRRNPVPTLARRLPRAP